MTLLIEDGLRYPMRGSRPTDLFTIGGILGLAVALLARGAVLAYPTVLSVALACLVVLPVLGLVGYLVRAFEATLAGDDAPPAYGSARELLAEGARGLVASIAYLAAPLAIVLVTVDAALSAPADGAALDGGGSLLFVAASTVTLILVLAFAYAYPAAIGAVARGKPLARALDLRRHASVLGNAAYFTGWSFALMIALAGLLLTVTALASANLLGVLAVFLAFYAYLAAVRMVATGYRKALGIGPDGDRSGRE